MQGLLVIFEVVCMMCVGPCSTRVHVALIISRYGSHLRLPSVRLTTQEKANPVRSMREKVALVLVNKMRQKGITKAIEILSAFGFGAPFFVLSKSNLHLIIIITIRRFYVKKFHRSGPFTKGNLSKNVRLLIKLVLTDI